MHTVEEHESNLLAKMIERLKLLEGVRLIGTAKEKIAVQSFIIQDIHSHDIGTILDHQGIAIRTGHHCAMPAMEFFGLSGTARASLSVYNNEEDIDRFISGLAKVMEIFS
jgi:cysteine desulfurase/selenocysteine lyase